MKRKIYFISQSVITFLLSVYSIIVANKTVKATVESLKQIYSDFPQELQDRVIGIYEKAGVKLTILFALIVIFSSICIFIFALNNTLLRHKGLVITFSIFTFFFTDLLLVQLLGMASFIIILCCKRKNPEDYPDKIKREIPKLKLDKPTKKDLFLGVVLLTIYFSQFIWSRYLPDKFSLTIVIEVLFNILMIILCIMFFKSQIKHNLKIFKENFKAYIRFILPRFGMAYVFLFIFSFVSILITNNVVSVNQKTAESLPIYYLIPAVVIYAPIVEEILFRGVIRRFIKNNTIFIIISALVFGILHTIGEASIINILVMSLPYASLGAYLAYIYTKTNNIFSNITSHMLFNLISTIFIIFI